MSTVLIIFCVLAAITLSTAFLTIFSRNPIHSAIYLGDLFFLDCGSLLIIEFSIFGNCTRYCILGSNYDFVFIYDHVDEFE